MVKATILGAGGLAYYINMAAVRSFTKEEISKHNSPHSLYMVIHGKVYDCTKFVNKHPGGEEVILEVAGQDATEPYDEVGHSEDADRQLRSYYIGELQAQKTQPKASKAAPRFDVFLSNSSVIVLALSIILVLYFSLKG